MDNKVDVFKALGDNNRVRILCMLKKRDLCVCEINAVLNVSMSTISSHLKILRNAGLVSSRKDGRWIFYSLCRNDADTSIIIDNATDYVSAEQQVINDLAMLDEITPANCSTV